MNTLISKTATMYIIIIAFASFFIGACNGNNAGRSKNTDSASQQNVQRGEGEGETSMDTMHRGMDEKHQDMDTMHHRKHD